MSCDRIKMAWIIDTIDTYNKFFFKKKNTYNKFHNKFSFSQILIINFIIVSII